MPDNRTFSNKMQDFGLALSGDNRALQNVQFQRSREEDRKRQEAQGRQQRTQQLSADRKRIAAQDFRDIGIAINSGQIDQAKTRINDRLRVGSMLPDFDAVSSQHVKDLLDAGDTKGASEFLNFSDQVAVSGGFLQAAPKPESFVLGPEDIRFENGEEVARGMGKPVAVQEVVAPIPEAVIQNLSPEDQEIAREVYATAGGNNAGLNAMSGFIEAQAVASEAKITTDKARGMQLKAIGLASNILANDETVDVVGSIQGRGGNNMFDPENTQAIADIEELSNMLTADNLSMMSGVLSESDIKIIASVAGGGLDRRRSDKVFMKRVEGVLLSLAQGQEFTAEDLSIMSNEQLTQYKSVLERAGR